MIEDDFSRNNKKTLLTYSVYILLLTPIWGSLAFSMYFLVPRLWEYHKETTVHPLPETLGFLINFWTAFVDRPILPIVVCLIFGLFEVFYRKEKKDFFRRTLLNTFLLFSILALGISFIFMTVSASMAYKLVEKYPVQTLEESHDQSYDITR